MTSNKEDTKTVTLDDIFNIQKELMEEIKTNHPEFWNDDKPFEDYRQFMLASALGNEVEEYKLETHFKWWKDKDNYKVDLENRRKVELPDMFHFLIQLCIEDGVSASDLVTSYLEKVEENKRRQRDKY